MPDFNIRAGDTDKTIYIRLRDSVTGLAKTGLVFNSAGAVCSYVLPLAARAAITLATQTVTGAHSDGGFVEVDATNMKGLYRLDLPDAAIASGDFTVISIEFDGIIEESIEIPLANDVNLIQWLGNVPSNIINGRVLSDMRAISADATAANNLELMFNGTGYVNGNAPATQTEIAAVQADLDIITGADGVNLLTATQASIDAIEADTNELQADDVPGLIAALNDIAATDIVSAGAITTLLGAVANVDLVDVTTVNSDMRGTDSAALASVATEARLAELDAANLPSDLDAVLLDTGTTLDTKLNDIQGATFSSATDSLEAIRNRGDSAWITGAAALSQIIKPFFVVPVSIDLADTATVRVGIVLTNAIDDLPIASEITPGTITIDRKAIGGTSWSTVVSAAAMLEQSGMVYYDEVFDTGSGYAEGDSIRIQFESVSITADANTYNITGATGVLFQTFIRETMRGTDTASVGPNAVSYTYSVTRSDTGDPVPGLEVWITTDLLGTNTIWRGTTDAFGVSRDVNGNLPSLDPGTYYFWKQGSGFIDDDNPDTEVVS